MEERFDTKPKVKLNLLPSRPDEEREGVGLGRFPSWLHRDLPKGNNLFKTKASLSEKRLHTVCEEAKCPNRFHCWSKQTATFLVMGKECTRACGFCDIDFSKTPKELDADEPKKVAQSVIELDLKHVVITQVARDDLEDGGAHHLKLCVEEIKKQTPNTTIELLTSDLFGNIEALTKLLDAPFEIFNHNIETVRRLTPRVRHKATYERTLKMLAKVKEMNPQMITKSGLMVGLGEEPHEVEETLQDLHNVGVQVVTIGQYLQASQKKLRVKAFIHPEQFKHYESFGKKIGIPHLYCGPFVRSSYNAEELFKEVQRG